MLSESKTKDSATDLEDDPPWEGRGMPLFDAHISAP